MTHQPISSCNHLNIILTCKTSFIGNNFKYQLQNLWLNSGMPTAKTIHTPGCFYNMWTEGMVQKLKLFSLMTTLRAYLSFEGGEHLWIIISRPLMLCPFAVFLKTPKFYWKNSLLVRGIFKIQRLLLSRAIFTYMQKKWNCYDSVKELWICKGSTVQAWALLHHLGSDVWKEGEGLLGHHSTVLLIPLPSTCCKNCPWVRKKIPVLKCFAVA